MKDVEGFGHRLIEARILKCARRDGGKLEQTVCRIAAVRTERELNIVEYAVGSKSFRPDIQKPYQMGKCCEGYIVPSMVKLMYQLKSVLKERETMLKKRKVFLFLSP